MPGSDAARRASFAARGFAPLGRLLDDDALAALRAEHDAAVDAAVAAARWPSRDLALRLLLSWPDMHRAGPAWRALQASPSAARHACALLDLPAVRVVGLSVVAKADHGGPAIPWHQDLPTWPTADPRGLTVWIALDAVGTDADAAEGALRYLPLPPGQADAPPLDAPDPVTVPLAAGEAVAHHALTWHASVANRGTTPRRGVVLALVAADAARRDGAPWDEERHPVVAAVRA